MPKLEHIFQVLIAFLLVEVDKFMPIPFFKEPNEFKFYYPASVNVILGLKKKRLNYAESDHF